MFKNFKNQYLALSVLLLITCLSCSDEEKIVEANKKEEVKKDVLFTRMSPDSTGIDFTNTVKNEKEFNIFRYRNFYNGAGVGIGDLNNDGLPDVYLTSNMGENKLYLNEGDFKFKDITASSGTGGKKAWSTGVSLVDINNDGYLDIYVCNAGNIEGSDRKNELFINNGNLTFTESAAAYNLDENGFTTHAAFFDYDQDGDLDVYILNNSFIPVSSLGYNNKRNLRSEDWDLPEVFKGGGDKLLQNNNGKFQDVSEKTGIYGSLIGFGLGVTVGDVNNDLLPDIYVSNDFYERDYLYINQGDGSFSEEIKNWVSHLSLSSMGADMADINNDGYPEIFVTDMLPEDDKRLKNTSDFERYDIYKLKEEKDFFHQYMQNSLQLNNQNNSFSEIAFFSGVAQTDWSWGALIFDMDNDGFKDIYVSNGIYKDLTNQDFMDFFANDILQEMVLTGKKKEFDSIINKMPSTPIPNYAFKNNADLSFSNATENWGFSEPSFSNGSAYGDLDNDGDADLIVNNVNQELFVYRNNSDKKLEHSYLKLKLKGSEKNRFAIGSKVKVYARDLLVSQELIPTRGFQSSIDYEFTIGLGKTKKVDSIRVFWPDKKTQLLKDIEVNKRLVLEYQDASGEFNPEKSNRKMLLSEVKTNITPHKEDNYVDYDYEGLVSKMLSREGPAIAVADINADGNDDLYIGGAKNQPGKIYLQGNNGNFREAANSIFEEHSAFEDTAAVFADINGDGKPDLVVASGGNNVYADKKLYQTRIYINGGNGHFSASPSEIENIGHNSAVIAATDYDLDGDIDLFIGGRSVPGIYGINAKSQLLENDGKGNFKDVTEALAYELREIGMVTDAEWADIDDDQKPDLIISGDWMAPKIFKNTGDGLRPFKSNLEKYTGAWNIVKVADLNNDSIPDLILGNRGTNSFYNVENEGPVKIYINDFDNNGTIEQICTRPINGKDVPIHLRRELSGQIASLKKQNLKFSEYATKSIDELFPKEVISNSIVKNISTFQSMIAINKGDGNFELKAMPAKAQFSSIHAIEVADVNKDGIPDIFLAGNDYDLKPQFSRLDANYGLVLTGDDNGNYAVMDAYKTGFFTRGQVRNMEKFRNRNGQEMLILGINNSAPKIFKLEK
ncbi:VCBS repeat-containing protein [Zunongwangia sp. F363]|uniref:VCBS repeat-containing protein n=1 Tax=Autumnicola tepida TaxID=3075595 RepID=A0ABU3CA80_9FLAO|nr:VCBS repeat-containing protein [Zunongwangia sp. F363]MDT0643248.1 VCBS repeat-containing protein [Zunongwangia sp. F363]